MGAKSGADCNVSAPHIQRIFFIQFALAWLILGAAKQKTPDRYQYSRIFKRIPLSISADTSKNNLDNQRLGCEFNYLAEGTNMPFGERIKQLPNEAA